MSQQLPTDFDIDPLTTSGTELASILNRLNSAVLSMQSGTSRPAYAVQGFKWLDVTDTVNLEKFFTGSTDLSIVQYDTTNNVAEINGGVGFTDKTKAIKHKVSAVASTVPVAGDMQAGEFFLNTADKKLFFKDSSGTPQAFNLGYTKTETDNEITNRMAGFKNGIINGAFEVNQYPDIDTAPIAMVNATYQIDRHRTFLSGVTGTIQRLPKSVVNGKDVHSLKCVATSTASGILGTLQYSEIFYNGETKTFGAWVRSNSVNARLNIYDGITVTVSNPHSGGGAFEFLSVLKTISASATQLRATCTLSDSSGLAVSITTGDYIETTMWQLEDGSVATKFEQRPIGLESSLCKRYYQTVGKESVNAPFHYLYTSGASSALGQQSNLEVAMRVIPTATKVGTWTVSNCLQPTVSLITTHSYFLSASSISAGLMFFRADGIGQYLQFSAEL